MTIPAWLTTPGRVWVSGVNHLGAWGPVALTEEERGRLAEALRDRGPRLHYCADHEHEQTEPRPTCADEAQRLAAIDEIARLTR